MIYAPVLIPTLCRYEHFVRCIESLKKNTWAKFTDVYIALDYPAKETHKKGYEKICRYLLEDFSEFKSFNVIRRSENYGSGRNMKELREYVLTKYDRFIRTDDDVEFSSNFLEYMDKCLERYEKDDDIIAVSGYSYPVNWETSENATLFKCNVNCPMWGTGFWKDKFLKISGLIKDDYFKKNFDYSLKNKKHKNMIAARYLDFVTSGLGDSVLMKGMSDVALGVYLAVADKYVIMPTISKSRNFGFDGSGMYCQNNISSHKYENNAQYYDYRKQEIDLDNDFIIVEDSLCADKLNRKRLNSFDKRKLSSIIKAKIKVLIYKTLGRKRYYKLIERFNKKH